MLSWRSDSVSMSMTHSRSNVSVAFGCVRLRQCSVLASSHDNDRRGLQMGPSASILLRERLTEAQIDEIEQWLQSISSKLEGQRGDWWPFWIKNGQTIGLPFDDLDTVCAFGLTIEEAKTEQDYAEEGGVVDPEIRADIEERQAQMIKYLDYYPKESINVYAGCNEKIDHLVLGYLALRLAERHGGIIDMNGAITPSPPASGNHRQGTYSPFTQEGISDFVRSIPGRVFEMYYTIPPNRQWVSHIVDTTFLQAWLRHPYFHMVK